MLSARLVLSLTLGIGVIASPITDNDGPAYPNAIGKTFQRYVALGDSYSAGPGVGRAGSPMQTRPGSSPPYDEKCYQDSGSWPNQLYGSLNVKEFQFSACCGYTTQQIREIEIEDPQSNFGDPDLVTITLGGNDNSIFTSVITDCIILNHDCPGSLVRALRTIKSIVPELNRTIASAATFNRASDNDRIVIVMGYPALYNDVRSWAPLCRTDHKKRQQIDTQSSLLNDELRKIAHDLHAQFAGIPNAPSVYYADPEAPDQYANTKAPSGRTFTGHRFCELNPFESYFNGGSLPIPFLQSWPSTLTAYQNGLFHPITKGHTVMRDAAQNTLSFALQGGVQNTSVPFNTLDVE